MNEPNKPAIKETFDDEGNLIAVAGRAYWSDVSDLIKMCFEEDPQTILTLTMQDGRLNIDFDTKAEAAPETAVQS